MFVLCLPVAEFEGLELQVPVRVQAVFRLRLDLSFAR